MEEYCQTLNSLGDFSSESMMEHTVQYSILYTEKLQICNDSFISSLPTRISCVYIFFVILHSLQLMSFQIEQAREKTIFSPLQRNFSIIGW